MTLRTRIVAALVLAALIPMAVVLAVPLLQAEKRATEETAKATALALKQASKIVALARVGAATAADGAAEALAADPDAIAAVLRGPESVARPTAKALAERFNLDRVEVNNNSGATLSSFGATGGGADSATLIERRRVAAESETLTLVATRILSGTFVADVAAITGRDARLHAPGAANCPSPRVEVAVAEGTSLCISVLSADAKQFRYALLKSFARVAPVAFLVALAVGLVIASRIAGPIRKLADRAQSISAQHAHPITLLEEHDETRRMTLAFDQMLDALQSSERRRLEAERVAAWEEIAKRLAHEIKNPLSPIQLAVENLIRTRERAPGAFDEAFLVETRTILEEVGSLRALVDEFAQFARLPRPTLAPCDPRAIVEQALALYSGRIQAMGVTVARDDQSAPASIRVDAEQISRVLKNVVANALDALEGSPERTLSIATRVAGNQVLFTVTDTGRGFDAETLRRLFEPYFTTRADRGGTGLGMAIAKRITVEHGGTLTASGAPGRGATVTLALPVIGPSPQLA